MKLTNEEIVSRYKASTNKMSEVESIVADTGIDPVDLFVLLIECNSIDGRMFRQGVYSEEWHQAKNRVKDENIKQAGHAIVTMSELKKENEELKKKCEGGFSMDEKQYIERIRGLEEELEEANSELGKITAAYQKVINQDEDLKKTVEEIIRIQTRLEKAEKFILNTVVYNNEERENT